ncbi:transcriptional repressor, partial [Lacticaseibacillus paracasei]
LNYFEKQVPGAKIQSHNFELYGLCAECQQHADRLKNA